MVKQLDGESVANEIITELADECTVLRENIPGYKPGLAIIQIGESEASAHAIKVKAATAFDVGITVTHLRFPKSVKLQEILDKIYKLNSDPDVHGIAVQVPFESDRPISVGDVLDAVAPSKDVEGRTSYNAGLLSSGKQQEQYLIPCVPAACLELLKRAGITIRGKLAVILTKGPVDGVSMSALLQANNATVTLCRSKNSNRQVITRTADILIVSVKEPKMVKSSWVKPDAVVIDWGLNPTGNDGLGSLHAAVGDVDYEGVAKVAGWITPVPGGFWPLPVAMLLKHTIERATADLKNKDKQKWNLSYLPLKVQAPMPSNHAIASGQSPKSIIQLATEIGIFRSELRLYGDFKAKVSLSTLKRLKDEVNGKYVFVTGITPTLLGKGKSSTTIGLAQALGSQLKKNSFACIQQPSLVPTFSTRGEAAGSGYTQVIPMDEFNLHLTGDIHAVTAANNLLAAAIDARMFHEKHQTDEELFNSLVRGDILSKNEFCSIQKKRLKRLGIKKEAPGDLTRQEIKKFVRLSINPFSVTWQRVVDTCDRFLRQVTIGLSHTEKGYSYGTQFNISAESEIMAILALSTSIENMCNRLGNIVVASSNSGSPITADDLGVTGALAALLKDAIQPNLMQTLEGTPVFVHGGSFGYTNPGSSSVLADKIALKLVGPDGFVVTEAEFGADIGMEKFFNIKCRQSGLIPNVVVLVANIGDIKVHGGGPPVIKGMPLPQEYLEEHCDLVEKGFCNVTKHISNAKLFGFNVIFALETCNLDTFNEIELALRLAKEAGVHDAVTCSPRTTGSKGCVHLAKAVMAASEVPTDFHYLYKPNQSIREKITFIARKIYGAKGVKLSAKALRRITQYASQGFNKLPICIVKTSFSISHEPEWKGEPKKFNLPVEDVRPSVGAGYLCVIVGIAPIMPSLRTRPSFYDTELDPETMAVTGLR